MGWLGAVGGFLEDKLKNKILNGNAPSATPASPIAQQPPDPINDTLGYAKYRAQHTPLGQAIAGVRQRYRQQNPSPQPQQPDTGVPMPQPEAMGDPDLAGLQPDMMAHGRMVTKPTVALLGERGPEAVVPMNSDPNNKISMPAVPGMRLPMVPHPRYRR